LRDATHIGKMRGLVYLAKLACSTDRIRFSS